MNLPSGVLVPVCRHGEPKPAVLSPLVNHCTTCVNIKTKPSTYAQLQQQKSPHFANFSLFFHFEVVCAMFYSRKVLSPLSRADISNLLTAAPDC